MSPSVRAATGFVRHQQILAGRVDDGLIRAVAGRNRSAREEQSPVHGDAENRNRIFDGSRRRTETASTVLTPVR